MADGHFYKKIITTGTDYDANHIGFYAKATGLFYKIFGATEKTIAVLESPAFTGTPSLPTGTTGITQSLNDNSTKLATTAYVDTSDVFTIEYIPGILSPADSTTYYIGKNLMVPTVTATDHDSNVGIALKIVTIIITVTTTGTTGSGENSTLQIRNVTQGTSTSVGTFTTNAAATVSANFTFTGLSIAVAATDFICCQWDAPAYATNPTAVRVWTTLICKRTA